MEADVRDCFQGEPSDEVLTRIVELTISELVEGRPLFPNPMNEPAFYRKYLKQWLREELDTDRAIAKKQAQDIAALNRQI